MMTIKNPSLISAVIPVYNGERYLSEAIESVLSQTYSPIEIVVIDDGSTDGSAKVAKGFAPLVRYFYQKNAGASAARNHGIECARGEFFAFLDADDRWIKEKLSLQMQAFAKDENLDMVFGQARQFSSDPTDPKRERASEILPGYSHGTMLIRRPSFFRVGLFDTHWKVGEFIDWYSKAKEKGLKSSLLPEVLLDRRLHHGNMGLRRRGAHEDYARILKASLDRKRGEGTECE